MLSGLNVAVTVGGVSKRPVATNQSVNGPAPPSLPTTSKPAAPPASVGVKLTLLSPHDAPAASGAPHRFDTMANGPVVAKLVRLTLAMPLLVIGRPKSK